MPDWLTHLVIGLVLIEIFNVEKKSLILLGAILPDLIPKLVLLRLFVPLPDLSFGLLNSLHVPFILFLFTLLIAPVFRYDYKKVVLWLNIGTISHFLADALLRNFGNGGVKLLYPLTIEKYNLNLVWPNESYYILVPALLVYLVIIMIKKKNHNFNIKLN